jgi:gas vesicle protein
LPIALPSAANAKTINEIVDVFESLRKDIEFYLNKSDSSLSSSIKVGNSSFEMSANEIKLSVVQLKDGISNMQASIDIQADQIQSKVSADYVNEQLAPVYTDIDGHEQRIKSAESSITQNAEQIALKVSQTDFNGNTIASLINQTATTISIDASKINMSGFVTFTSLSTPGQVTIDGGNITGGTITGSKWQSSSDGTPYEVYIGTSSKYKTFTVYNGAIHLFSTNVSTGVSTEIFTVDTSGVKFNGQPIGGGTAKFG